MSLSLENEHYQLLIDPSTSTWSLVGRGPSEISFEDLHSTIEYRRGQYRTRTPMHWSSMEYSMTETADSPHGLIKTCLLQISPDRNGLQYTISFALPEAYPTFFWKLSIENHGHHPLYIEQIDFLDTLNRSVSRRSPIHNLQAQAFFSNGWQSWSYSGTYSASDRQSLTRLGPLTTTIQYNRTTPRPRRGGRLVSDMFGVLVDRVKRQGVLIEMHREEEGRFELACRVEAAAFEE